MRRSLLLLVAALALCIGVRPATAQPRQIGVLLVPGWNNIGYVGASRPIAAALSTIAGKYESIWTLDTQTQRWMGVNPLVTAGADFKELRQNQAYWIRMSSPGELLMDVPSSQPAVTLGPGWNNFVYVGAEQPVQEALAGATGRFEAVWRWDAARQGWHGYTAAAPFATDFSTLGTHRSYLVQVADGPAVTMVAAPPPQVRPLTTGGIVVGTPFTGSTAASPPNATPTPTASPRPGAGATPLPAPPRAGKCYNFQSYQPQVAEVARALTQAGHGTLTTDPDFKVKDLETQPDGSGGGTAPFIPPTLLKAISWVESGWRQATPATARGSRGSTIVSTSCAYGLMQVLTGMEIGATMTPKQQKIGGDYLSNTAGGAQLLGIKWNLGPEYVPVVTPRDPRRLESWYYAVWAYHCYGEVCLDLGIHNNPDDPALKWPRPVYNSPDQLASSGQYTFGDYPYQELVYGVIANPPKVSGVAVWPPLAVALPPRNSVGFPEAGPMPAWGATADPTPRD